jgi:hypothetical protein
MIVNLAPDIPVINVHVPNYLKTSAIYRTLRKERKTSKLA